MANDVAPAPNAEVLTVADAAQAIGKLNLFGTPEPPAKPADPPVARDKATGKFVKKDPAVEPPPQPADEPAAAAEDAPADAEEQPVVETEDEDAPPPLPKFKVKVDGQEIEVDESELKAGYSRTQDYTRKTQALAREREKFEQEELQAVREERRQLQEKLHALSALIPEPGQEPDWADLRNRLTPEEFADQFTEYQTAQKRIAIVREQQQALMERQRADEHRALAAQLKSAHERLGEMIPEWKDAEKGDALRNDLVAYAKSEAYGYSDQDLAYITDPRLVVILNKARLYDESQKRRTTLTEKVDRALVAKPSAPAPKARGKAIDEGIARLTSTGKTDDAAALIKALGLVKPRDAR